MQTIPVIAVAAWSGTGKTTLLERLIPVLKERGLRVCVMKHDAHEFEVDRVGKDSWRMTRAGADVTILTNGAHAAILENRPVTAEALLEQVHDVDLVLTEGYKHGLWKKIALYRAAVGKPFPCALEECIAVVTDTPIADCPVPCLGILKRLKPWRIGSKRRSEDEIGKNGRSRGPCALPRYDADHPGRNERRRFCKGHVVTEADIPVLLSMGKEHLYVWEKQPGMLHEDEAAEILFALCHGENTCRKAPPKEGKVELIAACDGLFRIEREGLAGGECAGRYDDRCPRRGFCRQKRR